MRMQTSQESAPETLGSPPTPYEQDVGCTPVIPTLEVEAGGSDTEGQPQLLSLSNL